MKRNVTMKLATVAALVVFVALWTFDLTVVLPAHLHVAVSWR